ncbi:Nipped-B-like protein B [Durusdinium trenchii]|uniref:Nipped-B-like protein B n=1 Tax=Durusdinium trenchii TaxID=1381693 RepID=A0ABP0PX67_9DINO
MCGRLQETVDLLHNEYKVISYEYVLLGPPSSEIVPLSEVEVKYKKRGTWFKRPETMLKWLRIKHLLEHHFENLKRAFLEIDTNHSGGIVRAPSGRRKPPVALGFGSTRIVEGRVNYTQRLLDGLMVDYMECLVKYEWEAMFGAEGQVKDALAAADLDSNDVFGMPGSRAEPSGAGAVSVKCRPVTRYVTI